MSMVRVAVPVLRGKRRFHLLKGRPWSPIEHLILQSLEKQPNSVIELSDQSRLSRRLIIEALVRLMRADWVEVSTRASGTIFSATPSGASIATNDELPNVPKSLQRWMTFIIDRITGSAFRGRELPIFEKHVLEDLAKRESIVWMQPSNKLIRAEPHAVCAALLDEDETIMDVDAAGDRLVDRFALLLVRNGKVEGLPRRAPAELEEAVHLAAKSAPDGRLVPLSVTAPPYAGNLSRLSSPTFRTIAFQQADLILGGHAHKEALTTLIGRAREHVIIHSTFISAEPLAAIMPSLLDAGRRGVRVDILWGENEDKNGHVITRAVISNARAELASASLESLIKIHPFSTNSHAKILVADDGRTGKDVAVIGSCNWLSSSFQSFEASVRLRDPEILMDVMDVLAQLSMTRDGLWVPLTTYFTRLSQELKGHSRPTGSKASAALVLGPQHGHFVREARDQARQRIFVTSHRLGAAAKQAVIIPAIAAARQKQGIKAEVYYGRPTGTVTGGGAADLTIDAGKDGVRLRSVHEPRLHAKILAWDDDSVVITSQNWLSADPTQDALLQEVGVFLNCARLADVTISTFENARNY